MTTLTVGPGEQYPTIAAAVAASGSGDTINVDAGTYTNDVLNISHSLSLQAVGGTVNLVATAQPANGKGMIDAGGPGVNVSISGFDISGVTVPDGNGAGVRYEGGNLTLTNDTIHGNQNGLLANADPAGSITVANSNFHNNGAGDGATHNIYVGAVGSLLVRDSTITAANVGHDIKSRAARTTITGNTITDGPSGTASYEIDLPNGGVGDIRNNTIEKGPNAQNSIAITSGEEGVTYADNGLTVTGNTIISDYTAHSSTAVVNDTGATAVISGNQLHGWTTVASGPADVSGNAVLASEPAPGSMTASNMTPSGAGGTSAMPAGLATGTGPAAPSSATPDTGSNAAVAPASLGLAPSGFIAGGPGTDPAQSKVPAKTQRLSADALHRTLQSYAAATGLPGAAQASSGNASGSDTARSQFWSSLGQFGTISAASLLGLDRHAAPSAQAPAAFG